MTDWSDVPDSTEPEPVREPRPRRRWLLVGVASTVAIGSALAVMFGMPKLGQWSLERAEQTHLDCSNSNYDTAPGASLTCEGEFRDDLAWAERVASTQDTARQKALEWTADELDTRLGLTTEVMLDREMQSKAADELARWMAQPGFPADRRTTDWAFAMIAGSGNREATIRHAALAADPFDRGRAMNAAIGVGDVAGATAIAKLYEADERDYDNEMRRGAWLCLVGARDLGLAALERAKADYEERVKHEYVDAEIGVLACGGSGDGFDGVGDEVVWAAEVLVEPRGSIHHLDPRAPAGEQARDVTSPLFADWLAGGEREPDDVVAYASLVRADVAYATTPWNFTGAAAKQLLSSTPITIDVRRHEAAASKLDAMIVAIEKRKLRIRPIGASESDVRRWGYGSEFHAARREPVSALRRASLALWLEVASSSAEAFDREGLARAIAHLPPAELKGEVALLLATYSYRVGDRTGARKWLATALEMPAGVASVDAELFLAMLELGEGRPRESLAAVARARAMTTQGEQELRAHPLAGAIGDDVTATMHRKIGWVEAAAALAAGETSVQTPVAAPDVHEGEGLPKDWFALARADDDVRKRTRFRMFTIDSTELDRAVLPAVVYVLHEVARDGKDPEVYVDAALQLHSQELNGITALRARAEAARMRGDTAAAHTWDTRAAALQALLTGPRELLLARLAGIV